MSRMIEISTDVFAAIWARRERGEATEDAILRRILECREETGQDGSVQSGHRAGGVYDSRNDVLFPEGFVVFRNYKGQRFEAIARGGAWVRVDTGRQYATLNQANTSIVRGPENVWSGTWRYRMDDGTEGSIADLRLRFRGESDGK